MPNASRSNKRIASARYRRAFKMPTLTYSPSVYNLSCHWARASLLSNATAPVDAAAPLTGYDVFRCLAILAVSCGLICGNLLLALAVNNKYTTGVLQFQVSIPSAPSFPKRSQLRSLIARRFFLVRIIFRHRRASCCNSVLCTARRVFASRRRGAHGSATAKCVWLLRRFFCSLSSRFSSYCPPQLFGRFMHKRVNIVL